MVLSSDELEILEYLKSCHGKSVGVQEICRCAGGRKKYREVPDWAKALMIRLVDANVIEVNERGHYRYPIEREASAEPIEPQRVPKSQGIVGEDYFPSEEDVAEDGPTVVGEDYFPSAECESDPEEDQTRWWISPQVLRLWQGATEENEATRENEAQR